MSLNKRSLVLRGHRTSVALEQEFWSALETWARADGLTVAEIVADVDARRQDQGLASALRVAVLQRLS